MSFNTRTSSLAQDNLFAGKYPDVEEGGTLITGQNLTRGTVLGLITASGKLSIFDTANADGTEIPYGVLLESTDATAADEVCPVAVSGKFQIDALTAGGTTDLSIAAVQKLLRAVNLYTVDSVDAQVRVAD